MTVCKEACLDHGWCNFEYILELYFCDIHWYYVNVTFPHLGQKIFVHPSQWSIRARLDAVFFKMQRLHPQCQSQGKGSFGSLVRKFYYDSVGVLNMFKTKQITAATKYIVCTHVKVWTCRIEPLRKFK